MSLRTQSDRLAQRGAAFRLDLTAIACLWNGTTYCVSATGIRESREIEAGGFEVMPNATMRISTTKYPAFLPAKGDTITFGTTALMVTAITPLPLAFEIKVDLGKA